MSKSYCSENVDDSYSAVMPVPKELYLVNPIKFALQTYRNAHNLGNEIQMLAARQFLPKVDAMIECDFWTDVLGETTDKFAMVMNGWYAHRPDGWPPPDNIVPLLISFHLNDGVFEGWNKLGMHPAISYLGAASEYLKKWGPVGTRDLYTLAILEKRGVPAYFSGCLTLTLRRSVAQREDFIACVDVPDEAIAYLRSKTNRPLVILSHYDTVGTSEERLAKAERYLDYYQRAHCVVTSRLHCAMPCLALETPVQLIDLAPDQYRFSGLHELVRHCDLREFLSSAGNFDFENPRLNDLDYLKYRNLLISETQKFIKEAPTLSAQEGIHRETSEQIRYGSLWAHAAKLREERDELRTQLSNAKSAPTLENSSEPDKIQRHIHTSFLRYSSILKTAHVYLSSNLPKGRPLKVLSFGCSIGDELASLKIVFPDAKVFGCDVNEQVLAIAGRTEKEFSDVFYGSPENIAKHGPYDLICAMSSLCINPAPANMAEIFSFDRFE